MPHSIPKDEKATRKHVPFWTADDLADTKEIPTYLFRLTAPATDGKTTESYVCPPEPLNDNLLDLESCDAADRLYQHLRPVHGHQDSCNFMSWSSSLSFLIQYAFYRSRMWWTDRNFDDIKLLVIDTRNLPGGIFAKDMDLLKVISIACKCEDHGKIRRFVKLRNGDYYFGEYLSQGALDLLEGECIQVSFGQMVDLGLFKLLPDVLKDEGNWKDWAKPVKSSRISFLYHEYAPPTSEDEVHTAIAIAKNLFKGHWSLPVAAMLLSLKPRQKNDTGILNGFSKEYGVDVIRDIISQGLIIDGERLPEVEQYRYIIEDIALAVLGNDESTSSDTDGSTDSDSTSIDDLAFGLERLSVRNLE